MKIRNIIKKEKTNKCLIALDDGSIRELSIDIVMKYGLAKGKEITSEHFAAMEQQQKIYEIKQVAVNIASYSQRTEKQIEDKLISKGYSKSEALVAIGFLREFGLVDDKKYAHDFVKSYISRKPAGRQKILLELLKRGIDREIAKEAIDIILQNENFSEIALKAAEKKLRLLKPTPPDKQKQALTDYLIRQGFEWSVVRKTVEEVLKC